MRRRTTLAASSTVEDALWAMVRDARQAATLANACARGCLHVLDALDGTERAAVPGLASAANVNEGGRFGGGPGVTSGERHGPASPLQVARVLDALRSITKMDQCGLFLLIDALKARGARLEEALRCIAAGEHLGMLTATVRFVQPRDPAAAPLRGVDFGLPAPKKGGGA